MVSHQCSCFNPWGALFRWSCSTWGRTGHPSQVHYRCGPSAGGFCHPSATLLPCITSLGHLKGTSNRCKSTDWHKYKLSTLLPSTYLINISMHCWRNHFINQFMLLHVNQHFLKNITYFQIQSTVWILLEFYLCLSAWILLLCPCSSEDSKIGWCRHCFPTTSSSWILNCSNKDYSLIYSYIDC